MTVSQCTVLGDDYHWSSTSRFNYTLRNAEQRAIGAVVVIGLQNVGYTIFSPRKGAPEGHEQFTTVKDAMHYVEVIVAMYGS